MTLGHDYERPGVWNTAGDHEQRIRDLEAAVPCCDAVLNYTTLVLGTASLVGYWPLNDPAAPARDLSSYGKDLLPTGGPVFDSPGPGINDGETDASVAFDGASDYLSDLVAGTTQYQFDGTDPWTYEVMLYDTNNTGLGSNGVVQITSNSYTRGQEIFVGHTQGGVVCVRRLGGGVDWESNSVIPVNTWVHLVVTYDGTTIRVYIDGALSDTEADSASVSSNASCFIEVGALSNPATFPNSTWKGSLARVAVYNAALSAETVAEHAYAASLIASQYVSVATQVIAGSGLTGGGQLTGDVTLNVNPDDSSLEISSDTVRVKALGVTNAMLAGGITEAKQTLADNTTNDVSTARHGYTPKAPNDSTKFLDGTGAWDTVKDSDLSLSDITTNDVTTSRHGLVPKAPNDASKFLRGDGTWNAPGGSGGGVVSSDAIWDAKGDLAVGTGADAATRLAVGSDGQVLTADSTQTTGARWAAPSSGDGWNDAGETWTYSSFTAGPPAVATFTIAGVDVTAKYQPGTKIRFKQGGAYKYMVVRGSSFSTDTTVTATGGTDYTLANASITDNYYSYQLIPQGWPDWFNWTSSPTGFSGTPTTTARFRINGRSCCININVNGTSNSTSKTFTLPIAVAAAAGGPVGIIAYMIDGGTLQAGRGRILTSGTTATCGPAGNSSTWVGSGTCQYVAMFEYEIS